LEGREATMNITRHNYEEYFILYMDNELGSDDRRQVELFVQENTDLKEELELLLQSKLTPDTSIVFDLKEQLMKSSPGELIRETNYNEWLLLYIDNELTAAQKMAAEELVANHPAIRTELELLQKTKLQPEQTIIFRNKESLYRREEKVRVISLQWRRIAVAAVLLIALGTSVFIALNKKDNSGTELANVKKNNEQPVLKSTDENSSDQQKQESIKSENQLAPENSNNEIKNGDEQLAVKNESVQPDKKSTTNEERNKQRTSLPVNQDAPVIADVNTEKGTNNLPLPKNNPNVNPELNKVNENVIARIDPIEKKNLTDFNENKQTPRVTPDGNKPLDNIVAAVSKEPVEQIETEQAGKKNKLRGFFRKVTRNFEKRTNIKATDDEDRLLLAGFSVKL
jgi:hypothetical protein